MHGPLQQTQRSAQLEPMSWILLLSVCTGRSAEVASRKSRGLEDSRAGPPLCTGMRCVDVLAVRRPACSGPGPAGLDCAIRRDRRVAPFRSDIPSAHPLAARCDRTLDGVGEQHLIGVPFGGDARQWNAWAGWTGVMRGVPRPAGFPGGRSARSARSGHQWTFPLAGPPAGRKPRRRRPGAETLIPRKPGFGVSRPAAGRCRRRTRAVGRRPRPAGRTWQGHLVPAPAGSGYVVERQGRASMSASAEAGRILASHRSRATAPAAFASGMVGCKLGQRLQKLAGEVLLRDDDRPHRFGLTGPGRRESPRRRRPRADRVEATGSTSVDW
jgi:hypothetical protein